MAVERSDVSVIIPAYNVADEMGRALESVARQTVRPGEVVVVDDGSRDGTAEAARAFAGALGGPLLKVVTQENRGAGAARNRAIRESKGAILAFLDADDEWLPEHLERSLAHMEAGGHALVAHNGWIVAADGTATLNDCARRFREDPDPYVALYRKGFIDTCTVLARREIIEGAGGFDETLPNAQDFEMWLNALRDPETRFLVFDEPLSRYHLRPGSIMSHTERRLRCTQEIAVRYAPVLCRRGGGWLAPLIFRITAVHAEAVASQRARGRPVRAVAAALRLPFNLVAAVMRSKRLVDRPTP